MTLGDPSFKVLGVERSSSMLQIFPRDDGGRLGRTVGLMMGV